MARLRGPSMFVGVADIAIFASLTAAGSRLAPRTEHPQAAEAPGNDRRIDVAGNYEDACNRGRRG
jgi:hypothetical protein